MCERTAVVRYGQGVGWLTGRWIGKCHQDHMDYIADDETKVYPV